METPKGLCSICHHPLVPIGHARKNGKKHDDWLKRTTHKKCWKQQMYIYCPGDDPPEKLRKHIELIKLSLS